MKPLIYRSKPPNRQEFNFHKPESTTILKFYK